MIYKKNFIGDEIRINVQKDFIENIYLLIRACHVVKMFGQTIQGFCQWLQSLPYYITAWGEWPSGSHSFCQVTEVKLGRVRSNSGWVTSGA